MIDSGMFQLWGFSGTWYCTAVMMYACICIIIITILAWHIKNYYYSSIVFQYIRKRKKFFAHDEREECREGDWVVIKGCKPLSDKKHYNVVEILERGHKSANSEPTNLTRQVVDSSQQTVT